MNFDDESLLSAYLDGELDPAQRLLVESALLHDPLLSEQLQQLAGVRTALAKSPRPVAEVDLSVPILERLEALPCVRWRRVLHATTMRRRLVVSGSAMAALLLVAILLKPPTPDRAGNTNPSAVDPRNGPNVASTAEDSPRPVHEPAEDDERVLALAEPGTSAVTSRADGVSSETRDAQVDREILRGYLDREEVRRLLVIVDDLSEPSLTSLRGVLQETVRGNPMLGEIRIAQGIEIDPAHPREAVVFLVVLEDFEYRHLRDNLRRHDLDAVVDDRPLEAAVVTQLADVGTMSLTPGQHIPSLRAEPPPHLGPLNLALPKPVIDGGPLAAPRPGVPSSEAREADSSPAIAGASNQGSRDSLGDTAPIDPISGHLRAFNPEVGEDREGSSSGPGKVYLVWVTTAQPRTEWGTL